MLTPWVKFFFWLYLLVLIWAAATVTNPADPDLWHRLALGEFLCQHGHFPLGDQFSYLADYEKIADHEWGSAVLFYGLYKWAGLDVFVAVKLATLTLTMVFIVWAGLYGRRPTLLTTAFYALVLLTLLPSFQSTVRCMTFTHLFFALWLYWFQAERHGRVVPIYFYLITMLVWANLHGGFAMGLMWLAVVGLVELIFGGDWKKWAIRFGACSLVSLINPFGLQLWISTSRALLTHRTGFHEWEPVSWWPDVISYPGYKLLLPGILVALALQLYHRGWTRMDRPIVVLIGFVVALSLTSARHTSLFAAVVGALAPGLFVRDFDDEETTDPLQRLGAMALGTVLVIVPLFSAFVVLPGTGFNLEYPRISSPRDAVDFLKIHQVRGNLLVPFNYGSYALWELRGQMRVSMDGRYDLVYRPETYRRVDDFFYTRGQDWAGLLTSPAPNAILIPIEDPVFARLQSNSVWKEAWHDDTDAVFLPFDFSYPTAPHAEKR